ncbi:MAG: hypothetical protein DDT20_00863 [Firmicutes bacterium]|nr:hypothetical protein [Bacillota bacterium]
MVEKSVSVGLPLSPEARAAKNAHQREWYRKNPEKRREHLRRYWEKRAEKEKLKNVQERGNGR